MTDRLLFRFPVGLEEGADGAIWVHALGVPGCATVGATRDDALAAFPGELSAWLGFLAVAGEPAPPPDAELEIAVDEWVRTDALVGAGESRARFSADVAPLTEAEIQQQVQRLGELRGLLLSRIRRLPDQVLDTPENGPTVRQMLEELARAQWWTLTRLGASPLGVAPDRTLGRLDTAMALVVQQFSRLPPDARGEVIELDEEEWTPRKVLRRLLWLEWSLGRAVRRVLDRRPVDLPPTSETT